MIYKFLIHFIIFIIFTYPSSSETFLIGESSQYRFCSEIENLVSDGDTVLIEAGVYSNDRQVTWRANNLLIKGINGRPILQAGEKIASDLSNGKGIFVIRGNNTIVENIKFTNSKVIDHNGAGIRQEGKNLIVRYCEFEHNEMGILQGGTIHDCTILIEHCKFINSGSSENPGYQHNVYINHIDTLIFRFNESYDAIAEGHELKSRATNNFIIYNRIENISSVDSRNIDLPNGGNTVIMGNLIVQGENSANSGIIGFGLEGLVNPAPHNLWIVNNTIVNKKNRGNFINVAGIDTLFLKNNICVGAMTGGFVIGHPSLFDSSNNIINTDSSYPKFIKITDYHLSATSPAINNGLKINKKVDNYDLTPEYEIISADSINVRFKDQKIDIGAYEYTAPTNVIDIENHDILIYPNPVNEYLVIQSQKSINEIKVFDFLGRKHLQFENPSNRINLSNLQKGIYLLQINNKFIKIIKN